MSKHLCKLMGLWDRGWRYVLAFKYKRITLSLLVLLRMFFSISLTYSNYLINCAVTTTFLADTNSVEQCWLYLLCSVCGAHAARNASKKLVVRVFITTGAKWARIGADVKLPEGHVTDALTRTLKRMKF